jgi:hypothetical protein
VPDAASLTRRLLAEFLGTGLGIGLWLGEIVATAGLVAVIVALARTGRAALSAAEAEAANIVVPPEARSTP